MLLWALMPNFNAVAHLVRPAERGQTCIHIYIHTDILVKTEEHLSTKVAALCAESDSIIIAQ